MTAHGGQPHGRRLFAPLLILLALLLLAFALRVHDLGAFSFWTDEGLTPARAGYPVAQILRNDILIQGVVTKDTHPPLYYLIVHVTRRLFGLSDFAFRYPSVLFGLLLVPLLYQLGRRLGGRDLGLLVALLAAVNPLQVYYSREARMYTLLVLLVTAMSYVLWRALSAENRQISPISQMKRARRSSLVIRHFLLYALLAALALYTHYTVVFLIAAQGLFWVWLLWRAGQRRVILIAAGLGALAAVPLVPYTVPRLLAGAEANYYAVPPLTMLLDVVRFFHLGLTVDFSQAVVVALNVLAFGLLLLGLWAARPGRARWFLLAWLLAVVLGLMAGSLLFKPMYQGVRHIMAGSPAFLLLLAWGILKIRDTKYERRVQKVPLSPSRGGEHPQISQISQMEASPNSSLVSRHSSLVSRLSYLVFLLLLAGSGLALYNLYANPAYVKDDFRAVIRFVETQAGNRDVIVYNNAVLLPLHEHYRRRPDIAVTALPAYPQFATGQEPELAALARDYDRIWFITDPPADGRDDDGLIQAWLDAHQTEVINRLFPARTTEARVIGYSTRGGVLADARPPAAGGVWAGRAALAGVSLGGPQPLTLPTLWVDLFWQGPRPPAGDTLLFTLTGPDGREAYRHALPLLPADDATRWDDAALNRLSYPLPLPPGLPPGYYTLAAAPSGQEPATLTTIEIGPTTDWPVPPKALFDDLSIAGRRPGVLFANGLTLAAVPADDAVLPGNNLPLTLYWRVAPGGQDLSNLRYRLEVIDARGDVLRVQEDRPGAPWLGFVPGRALLREDTGLYFRPETPPGRYRLRWTLLDGDAAAGEPATNGGVTVEPWPLVTDVPAAPYVVNAAFGDAIRLPGYDMGVPTGGLLNLTFYWQATAEPQDDYVVFVHLVDAAGTIVSQTDSVPVGGARPTSGWRAGEVVADSHALPIPAGLPPGDYHVNAGLYDPDDGARPAVTVGGAPQPDNQLRLTTLALPWSAP
ncbi:MAG: glycosyltransferase family 39 protein [Anaerolineae bacterium]|nr:glycosyltransferase family 39 protein [Anaerolineae bacterium]